MSIKRERLEEIIREEYNKLFVDEDVVGDAVDVATDVAADVVDRVTGTETYLDPLADFEDLDAGFEEMVVTLMDLLDATKETNDVLKDKLDLMIRVMDHNNDTLKDFIDTQDRGQKVSAKKEKVDEATINEIEPTTMTASAFGLSAIGTIMKERVLLKEILENIKRILEPTPKVPEAVQTVIDKIDQFDEKLLAGDEGAQYTQDFIIALSSLGTEGRFALKNLSKELKTKKKKRRGLEQILFQLMLSITQWLALSLLKLISKMPQKATVAAMKKLLDTLERVGPKLKTIKPIGQEQPEELSDVLKQLDDALGPNVNVKGPGRMAQQEDPPKPKPPKDMFGYIGKGFKENKTMTRTRLQQIIKEEVESVLFEDSGDEDLRRLETQAKSLFHRAKKKGTRALDQMISDYNIMVDYLGDRDEPIGPDEPRQIVDELFNKFETLFYDNMIRNLLRNLVGTPIDALKRVPKSEEVLKKIDTPVDDVYKIAGHAVKKADKEQIRSMIQKKSEESRGVRYSSTHQFMGAKEGESPEETVERLVGIRRQGIPGTITIYQDPETDEVFGYAEYNTF